MFFDKISVSPQILTAPGGDFFFCSISPSFCENLFPDNPSALCAGRYSDLKSSLPNSRTKKGTRCGCSSQIPKVNHGRSVRHNRDSGTSPGLCFCSSAVERFFPSLNDVLLLLRTYSPASSQRSVDPSGTAGRGAVPPLPRRDP